MDINDLEKLNKACKRYGIDANEAKAFKNVIVVPGSVDGLYVVFDKNYNTIDVRRFYEHAPENMYNYFEGVYLMYKDEFIETFYLSDVRDSSTESLSISHVVELSDKYKVRDCNQGHSTMLVHNGEELKADIDSINYMSYMQFLRGIIERYYSLSYKMKERNISFPTADRFITQVVGEINFYIDRCIMMERRPDPIEFVDLSDNKWLYVDYCDLLVNVFNLLLKHQGYKVVPGKTNEIIPIENESDTVNINDMIKDSKRLCEGKSLDDKPASLLKKINQNNS